MPARDQAAFFDGIAEQWDGWEDLEVLSTRVATVLAEFPLALRETVVDVGCGTGNLVQALLAHLGPEGHVLAVDISPGMLAVARRKIQDPRVTWYQGDTGCLPTAGASCDRVFCLSVWPHLADARTVLHEFHRVLRPGGRLHILHLAGREQINALHASTQGPVRRDVLPPVGEVATLLARSGFEVTRAFEDADCYELAATRRA